MPEPISSLQNPRIKQALRLRDASRRRESGLMIIDGRKEIRQAILGGLQIQELFIDSECSAVFDMLELRGQELPRSSVAEIDKLTTTVSTAVLEKLAFGNRNEGLVAIAKQPRLDLDGIPDRDRGLILVIDQVEKIDYYRALSDNCEQI